MKLKVVSSVELLEVAILAFGSRDGFRPNFPRRGESIQEAMKNAAARQLNQDRDNILEIIRDFEKWEAPEAENGEEEFKKKYGKGTIEVLDVIAEAVQV